MSKIDVFDIENNKIGEREVEAKVFSVPVKKHLFYEVVKMQLAGKRAGTSATKTRGMVSGGGSKPWRQKGTGRARAGSNRSPLWKGGGTVFGPSPRDYSYRLPKSARKAALRSVLSYKLKEGSLKVIKELDLPEIKTKKMFNILKGLNALNSLVVISDKDERIEKSARNIPFIKVIRSEGLNVYDILRFKTLLFTESSLEKVEDNLV